MFTHQRKPEAAVRAKKKVPKEFLEALKNTQKLPPGGRVEGGYPGRSVPHETHRRAAQQPTVNPPQERTKPPAPHANRFGDEILEDDIGKIAYEDNYTSQKKSLGREPTKQQTREQPRQQPPKAQPEKQPVPSSAPHVSDRPAVHNILVQSVIYPDNQRQRETSVGKPKQLDEFKQNRSYREVPHRDASKERDYMRVQDYERHYQTERKVTKQSHDPYYRPAESREPDYANRQRESQIPPSREELYRYYAEKQQRSNTLPDMKEEKVPARAEPARRDYYNQDLLYPPTNKAPERIVVNSAQSQKAPSRELKNITNGQQDPLMSLPYSSYRKAPQGYSSSYANYQRAYEKSSKSSYLSDMNRYADVAPHFDPYGTSNGYLGNRGSRGYRTSGLYPYSYGRSRLF